jgi:hypothetical protein
MIAKANNMIMNHRHSSQGDDCNARSRLPRLIGLRVLTWQPMPAGSPPAGFFIIAKMDLEKKQTLSDGHLRSFEPQRDHPRTLPSFDHFP